MQITCVSPRTLEPNPSPTAALAMSLMAPGTGGFLSLTPEYQLCDSQNISCHLKYKKNK